MIGFQPGARKVGFNPSTNPKIGFEKKGIPFNGEKLKKVIEPYTKELERRKKGHEGKLENHVMDLGVTPEVGMICATSSSVSSLAFAIFAILSFTVLPFAPMALFFIPAAFFLGFKGFKEFYLIFKTIAKESEKVQTCERWINTLRSPEWQSLDFLNPYQKLKNKAAKRINRNEMTAEDLKALLYLMEKRNQAKKASELDGIADELRREWKTQDIRADWGKRLYAL